MSRTVGAKNKIQKPVKPKVLFRAPGGGRPKGKHYLNDTELVYEIILSKGKGMLTNKGAKMLILIANNIMRRMKGRYKDKMDFEDCYQQGIYRVLNNWDSFNEKKFSKALPFYSEIMKRGIAESWNQVYNKNNISITKWI